MVFNTSLQRSWQRSCDIYDDFNMDYYEEFWQGCDTKHYYARNQYGNSYDRFHFKLQNGQEIKLHNTLYSFLATSGKETKHIYHNISNSWIDVALYQAPEYAPTDWNLIEQWRVHGQSPNPYDAPQHIIDGFSGSWPPSDTSQYFYKIETCSNIGDAFGTVQNHNVTDVNQISQGTNPIETHIIPVKGTWSGWFYNVFSHNELPYDILSLEFKKIRIEKYPTYHRFYIEYGDGAPIINTGGYLYDLVTGQDRWDSRSYGVTFDLLADGTIDFVNQMFYYNFPVDQNDEIVFDTVLDINKITSIPSVMSPLLSDIGQVEFQRIYDETALEFGLEEGTNEYSVFLAENNSLVKKQLTGE